MVFEKLSFLRLGFELQVSELLKVGFGAKQYARIGSRSKGFEIMEKLYTSKTFLRIAGGR